MSTRSPIATAPVARSGATEAAEQSGVRYEAPLADVDFGCFWEPWATTREERAESVAAVKAYARGEMAEVDRYLERRHQRWQEHVRQRGWDQRRGDGG